MNAEQHALAILRTIQQCEKDGYRVEAFADELLIGDIHILVEPQEEDCVWDWEAGE